MAPGVISPGIALGSSRRRLPILRITKRRRDDPEHAFWPLPYEAKPSRPVKFVARKRAWYGLVKKSDAVMPHLTEPFLGFVETAFTYHFRHSIFFLGDLWDLGNALWC